MKIPTSVARIKFEESLISLINDSSLPPYIIEPIIKDVYEKVRIASRKLYESELAEWENSSDKNG